MVPKDVEKVVELPVEVKDLLNRFSVAVSFGISGVGSVLECLNMRGYPSLLALYMVAPAAIALIILFMGLLLKASAVWNTLK